MSVQLEAFWQENKRFTLGVLGGFALFGLGCALLQSLLGDELASTRRDRSRLARELAQPLHTRADEDAARADNEALRAAASALAALVGFEPRARFRLDAAAGAASSQYHRVVAEVQDELLQRAGRANLALDRTLGLPALSPTRDEEIERYLHALDAIERAVGMAIDAGATRLEKIEIRLDPGLSARAGTGRVERTQVRLELVGSGAALERFALLTQDPARGGEHAQPLVLDELDLLASRNRAGEVRLSATALIARLRPPETSGS